MLQADKAEVLNAIQMLVRDDLDGLVFGSVSAFDRSKGFIVIKPTGLPLLSIKLPDLVVTSLEGAVIEGSKRPSRDLFIHIEIYKAFDKINGIVHTHSKHATAWAQAQRELPCLGTSHADFFRGAIPVTRMLSTSEVTSDIEKNTGKIIIDRFSNVDPLAVPGVLVAGHGPFCWGKTIADAAHHATVLERIAELSILSLFLNSKLDPLPLYIIEKHNDRERQQVFSHPVLMPSSKN